MSSSSEVILGTLKSTADLGRLTAEVDRQIAELDPQASTPLAVDVTFVVLKSRTGSHLVDNGQAASICVLHLTSL